MVMGLTGALLSVYGQAITKLNDMLTHCQMVHIHVSIVNILEQERR